MAWQWISCHHRQWLTRVSKKIHVIFSLRVQDQNRGEYDRSQFSICHQTLIKLDDLDNKHSPCLAMLPPQPTYNNSCREHIISDAQGSSEKTRSSPLLCAMSLWSNPNWAGWTWKPLVSALAIQTSQRVLHLQKGTSTHVCRSTSGPFTGCKDKAKQAIAANRNQPLTKISNSLNRSHNPFDSNMSSRGNHNRQKTAVVTS